ncbi:MAG: ribonuclease Z [Candidatus Bathyarchaeota archaeon B63]|nr:MAG: ribonuclease Z [Candidatus Bathyarchaeota archaeon B63]
MIKARIGFNRETKILITHMHGDHVLGLPGILQTMSLLGREKPLSIYGPEGIAGFIEAMKRTVRFRLRFPVEVYEVGDGLLCSEEEYEVHSTWAEHSVPSLAYALIEKPRPGRFNPERAAALGVPRGPLWSKLQRGSEVRLPDGRVIRPGDVLGPRRPGRKIVYVGDSRPSENIVKFASEADVLIHEATFADDLSERAEEEMHSTPTGAALVARKANVKLLVLTHISARYDDPRVLLEEARRTFPNVLIAEDLMTIDVPFRD